MFEKNWSVCEIVCWAIAVFAGVVAYLMAHDATSVIAALMLGIALAVLLALTMTRLFCSGSEATGHSGQAPVATSDIASQAAKAAAQEPAAKAALAETPAAAPLPEKEPVSSSSVTEPETDQATPDYDGDGVHEGTGEGTRPEGLSGARDGKADNLKEIKGIGPKLEKLCNSLGFFHFDQIAGWTDNEVAWVNANLEGFKGRVTRDDWVAQAKILAAGGETEFSKRVEDGDVY